MENKKIPCEGFLEKLVLSIKNRFLEEDILQILIRKSADSIVYNNRGCRGESYSSVCEPCKLWFEKLADNSYYNVKLEHNEAMLKIENVCDEVNGDSVPVRHQSVIRTTKEYSEDAGESEARKVTVEEFFHLDQDDDYYYHDVDEQEEEEDEEWKPGEVTDKPRTKIKQGDLPKVKRKYVKKKDKLEEEIVSRKYFCTECKKEHKSRKKLYIHERDEHGLHQEICDICGKSFKNPSQLKYHILAHEKGYESCDICGLKVKQVKTHKLNVHADKSIKPFICEKCGEAFRTKERHDYHMRRHEGLKPFKCLTCQKCYTGRSGAKRCEKMHKGPEGYRYTCTFCGFKVMDKEKLRNHLRTHTREKPFRCPLCNYQAARRDYMKKHLNSLHKDRSIAEIERMYPQVFKPETITLIPEPEKTVEFPVKAEIVPVIVGFPVKHEETIVP